MGNTNLHNMIVHNICRFYQQNIFETTKFIPTISVVVWVQPNRQSTIKWSLVN